MARKKEEMQYRYYEMPEDSYVFALTGKSWIRIYGEGIPSLHFHNYAEIGLCHEGTGDMIYDDGTYTFRPGCYTFIPPNYPHTTNSVPGTYGFWEYLFSDCESLIDNLICSKSPDSARNLLDQLYKRAYFFEPGEQPELLDYIKKLFKTQTERKPLYKAESTALLTLLLTDVIRLSEEKSAKEEADANLEKHTSEDIASSRKHKDSNQEFSAADIHNQDDKRLRPAIQYVKEHYMEDIYIGKLADACALSETHFRRLFHECTHLSPLEYINSVRIHNACVILRSTNKTIRDVTFDTGFTSVSTFQRNFRKYVGMATHEWRHNPENYEYKLLQYKINTYEGW
jgi:AraC-like DNA-binding protein